MNAGPDTIYIIRHAEKPPGDHPDVLPRGIEHDGHADVRSLTTRGWQRAGALVSFFAGNGTTGRPGPTPAHIFAPDYGAHTPRHRTTQTVTPLSQRLGTELEFPVGKGEEHHLVPHILRADGPVLVCWEHHHIHEIVAGLGRATRLGPLPPIAERWPDDVFDQVLVFSRTNDGGYTCSVTAQHLLPGDSHTAAGTAAPAG